MILISFYAFILLTTCYIKVISFSCSEKIASVERKILTGLYVEST